MHAAAIKSRGDWVHGAIDSASRGRSQVDGEQLLQSYTDLGLHLSPADNAVESGIYDVWERRSTGRLKVSTRPGNLANSRQVLAAAHAYMLRRHGKAAPAAASPAAGAAPAKPGRGKERPPPDRSKLGVTLAAVPAAADARITSEFADLDGIETPAKLERELPMLSPRRRKGTSAHEQADHSHPEPVRGRSTVV